MTYEIDQRIDAVDFNGFQSDLDGVWGVGFGDSGYGQVSNPIPSVITTQIVDSDEWTALQFAAVTAASHQGSIINFPPATDLELGDRIDAHESDPPTSDPYDINSSIATLVANRLIADPGSVTLNANALNDSRVASWSNQLLHIFTVTFTTVDEARYFFNTGGEVRIRGSRSGGAVNAQNTDWSDLLTNMGTIAFNFEETTSSGSATVAAIGYYDLTTSFQQIATISGTGAYASNDVTIFARTQDGPSGTNGDTGRVLEFRVEYNDDHTNGFFDAVDGTITSDVDYVIGDVVLPDFYTPAFATTTSLTAGT